KPTSRIISGRSTAASPTPRSAIPSPGSASMAPTGSRNSSCPRSATGSRRAVALPGWRWSRRYGAAIATAKPTAAPRLPPTTMTGTACRRRPDRPGRTPRPGSPWPTSMANWRKAKALPPPSPAHCKACGPMAPRQRLPPISRVRADPPPGAGDAMRLAGKTAMVTGGARGIGAAICRRYAEAGARVVVADRLEADAATLAAELGGGAFAAALDVTDLAAISRTVAEVAERAGGIDILVNNAAIYDLAPLLEITEAAYDSVFAVNVKGLLFTLQAVARQMVAQGRGGKIINLSSQAGRRGEALAAVYCASKAAVISLTQSAGLALIEHRINVNAIAPGVVDTPMWDHVDRLFAALEHRPIGEKKRLVGEAVPYGRMGTPDDIAGAAVFLASADADYIVAQTLNVDGGNWMS